MPVAVRDDLRAALAQSEVRVPVSVGIVEGWGIPGRSSPEVLDDGPGHGVRAMEEFIYVVRDDFPGLAQSAAIQVDGQPRTVRDLAEGPAWGGELVTVFLEGT